MTQHWRDQIDDPRYDLAIITSDDESTGSVDDLADEDADRLLLDAVERHPGVRSRLGVAAPAAAQDRLRAGGTDHRPARGARVHRRIRRVERARGPAPGRRPGPDGSDEDEA